MAGERRRDYMVSKRVHLFYMLTWVSCLLLVASFAGLVYTLLKAPPHVREVEPLLGLIHPFLLLGLLAFFIVCTSLGLGVYTVLHTHHLLGSAYRIGVVLREINEGKGTRVKLRDGDFFMDIGDEINRLADQAQGKTGSSGPAPAAAPSPAAGGDSPSPSVPDSPASA